MKKIGIIVVLLISVFACTPEKKSENTIAVPLGHWRAALTTQGKELPFDLISRQSEKGDIEFIIKNGGEEIVMNKFDINGDSLVLPLHIFDTKIVAKISKDKLNGYYTKNYEQDYRIPFKAELGEAPRFKIVNDPVSFDFSGRWETEFKRDGRTYPAIGEFQQSGNKIIGSFLTNTGDYRFLEGSTTENGFSLSTFDGEHAYLFEAKLKEGDTIVGEYWSGKTGYLTWKAFKNENAVLSDPYQLTEIQGDNNMLDLAFPNEQGNTVSLSEDRFKNKVVLIQILGSWCANCMDETAFLSDWYRDNSDRGVEIIGLAFERKADLEYGTSRIKILKDRYNIDYEILFAGKNDKESIANALPMLKKLVSFPTTIFLNKNGEIAKIHTGFSGPGTGNHYAEFVEKFNQTMDELIDN